MAHAHLESFPFPLAHPGQLLRSARSDVDRLDQAQHLIEMTAVTLGVLVIAWHHAHAEPDETMQKWEKKFDNKGIALGDWISILKAARPQLIASSDSLGRSLGLAVDASVSRLDGFTPTRNQFSHGGRPRTTGDRATAATNLSHRADTLFDSIESLRTVSVARVRGCSRTRGGMYETDLDVFTGPAETGTPRQISSRRHFDPGTLIAFSEGQLETAADLFPFILLRSCPACNREELFYLSKRIRSKAEYFTFANGHKLVLNRNDVAERPLPLSALGTEALTARRTEAAQGWRAQWQDLAPRHVRLLARTIDVALVAVIVILLFGAARLIGLTGQQSAVIGALAGLTYEPVGALRSGTVGKRVMHIVPISIWDSRPLTPPDAIRRAALIDLQLLLPVIAIRTAAWIIWDPARQGVADRVARSIVVQGRPGTHQKR